MSEPWRDEPTPPALPPLLQRLLEGPTSEERDQRERDARAAIAEGEPNFDTLPRFTAASLCVKCGQAGAETHYCDPVHCRPVLETLRAAGTHPVMVRTCRCCGFVRYERPLDAAPAR